MIVGREKELNDLRSALEDEYSQFIAIYGRRRIGKTFLIREAYNYQFTFQHAGLYNESKAVQLTHFCDSLKEAGLKNFEKPKNYLQAFELLKDLIRQSDDKKKIIFLDELSWMDSKGSDLIVALEGFWNSWASARKDIVLVVCGSATSWIVENIVHNKGGLYNRLTNRIHLKPFSLKECELLLQANNIVMNRYQILECYMIFGGVPYYWDSLEKGKSVAQNIDAMFFQKYPKFENEFEYIFCALYRSPEQYMAIVAALGKKKAGMNREELLKATKIANSGDFSKKLEELESCGFIRKYNEFGKKKKDSLYQLIDNFTLFYYRFLENKSDDEGFWTHMEDSPLRRTWRGLAFERVCLEHTEQIKKALGISGVLTNVQGWYCKADKNLNRTGAQIDLLIERRDQIINICEMKYCSGPYTLNLQASKNMNDRLRTFKEVTKTRNALHLTVITPYGLADNSYFGDVQAVITADDLFL